MSNTICLNQLSKNDRLPEVQIVATPVPWGIAPISPESLIVYIMGMVEAKAFS